MEYLYASEEGEQVVKEKRKGFQEDVQQIGGRGSDMLGKAEV